MTFLSCGICTLVGKLLFCFFAMLLPILFQGTTVTQLACTACTNSMVKRAMDISAELEEAEWENILSCFSQSNGDMKVLQMPYFPSEAFQIVEVDRKNFNSSKERKTVSVANILNCKICGYGNTT